MRTCIFIGPSGANLDFGGITVLPPATLGSVFRAAQAGYSRIALVDGYFGDVPSVWHKEILFALAQGTEVWGAASVGALRASELAPYGMIGVGAVFRLYCRQFLTNDDEVCLTHAPRELHYIPLTFPMVNIRYTLRQMRRRRLIGFDTEEDLTASLKEIYFAKRDHDAIKRVLRNYNPARWQDMWSSYLECYVDVKRLDVISLLGRLNISDSRRPPKAMNWEFPRTSHWAHQFIRNVGDLPAHGVDYP